MDNNPLSCIHFSITDKIVYFVSVYLQSPVQLGDMKVSVTFNIFGFISLNVANQQALHKY